MYKESKIYIAGHMGLVGSAIHKNLLEKGYSNLVLRTPEELDLRNQADVQTFFEKEKPEYVFLAAAKVGGIWANNVYRADFIYDNLSIQQNVIGESYKHQVKKLLFLGSTCIYPCEAPQPMREDTLLTGPLEYTNEPYAIAKIAGLKLCESFNLQYQTNFLAVMPTNLYGPNDNFDLERSHVLPAMIRKIYLGKCLEEKNWDGISADFTKRPIEGVDGSSKEEMTRIMAKYGVCNRENKVLVEIWGTGNPLREFLWSEEMADACVFVMEKVNFEDVRGTQKEIRNCHINIGTGKEISIAALANKIKEEICFSGDLFFNTEKPDGTLRKLTDVSKLHSLGWKHSIEIEEGIRKLYQWYVNQ